MLAFSNIPYEIKNIPADEYEISLVESKIGIRLPNAYKALLSFSNGILTKQGIFIYGTEDIVERNETWEVKEYAPGYIAIGDNSGGTVYLMLQDIETTELLSIDSGSMNPCDAEVVTNDFLHWISVQK